MYHGEELALLPPSVRGLFQEQLGVRLGQGERESLGVAPVERPNEGRTTEQMHTLPKTQDNRGNKFVLTQLDLPPS